MINRLQSKVYYSDTDAYGIVWHGSYLRWLEMGRVELLQELGTNLKDLAENQNIIMPVVEVNLRYKSSAVVNDIITVETKVSEVKPTSIVFMQTVKNSETGKVNVQAKVTAVTTDCSGKLYRKLPHLVSSIFLSQPNTIKP